jgi:DNA-binding PadR family transcriptional regulator
MLHIVKDISRRPAAVPLGEFEQLVLLALLRLGDNTYGAMVRREIETRTGRTLAVSAVYITLDRLETKGLIRTYVGEPTAERGGRRKKHLVLLPAGRRAITMAHHAFRGMAEGLEAKFNPR